MRNLLTYGLLLAMASAARGEPWQRHVIDDSSRGADGVRLADVNGDGYPDIATGWEEGGVIRVYVNPGPRRSAAPWPAVTAGRVKSPEDAVLVDLDADGAFDVVSSCEGRNRTMYVHWAPRTATQYLDGSAWQTEAFPATREQQSWMFALPLQVDGSGGVDLVVGSKGGGAGVGWLQAPPRPREVAAWKYHRLCDAGWIMSIQAHDMDGDRDPDLLVSDRNGPLRGVKWIENPGPEAAAAGRPWPVHRVDAGDREVMFLTVGDLGRNGRPDIVCAVKGRGISLITRPGDRDVSWQVQEVAMPANCGSGKGAAVCDVNLDGRPDIVFSCEHADAGKSGMRWLSYRNALAEPVWDDHEISGPAGIKFDRLEVLDLDGDGDPDVLTCEERELNAVLWYENPWRSP